MIATLMNAEAPPVLNFATSVVVGIALALAVYTLLKP